MTDLSASRPRDAQDLQAAIEQAVALHRPLEVIGKGTKRSLGRPVEADGLLDLSALDGVIDYEPSELVLTARPATPLVDIERLLAQSKQMLAFEPPDWSLLMGSASSGTLGGALACNLAGPRRLKAGAARDHLLGFHGVSGHGVAFKSGGRVVKNVTGYDLSKLICGSMGTLAALAEVSVKTLPRPEIEQTLVLRGRDDVTAIDIMTSAMGTGHEVSSAAHLPAHVSAVLGVDDQPLTLLRLEGLKLSVEARYLGLQALFDGAGRIEAAASCRLWEQIRDVAPFAAAADRLIWRVSLPPAAGSRLVGAVTASLDADYYYDWAGGLVWLSFARRDDAGALLIRNALACVGGGHATLIRAPEAIRRTVAVFQPEAPQLAALGRRVKDSFDPLQILNPGRIYADV